MKKRCLSKKERQIRADTDALIAEVEKYTGPLPIQQQQIAYTIMKEHYEDASVEVSVCQHD